MAHRVGPPGREGSLGRPERLRGAWASAFSASRGPSARAPGRGARRARPSSQKEWEGATKKRLAAAVASAEKRGVSATSEFLWGRPSDVLVETAVKMKASLVVLGTHGRNALEKLLIGSTAERVVRLSPVPVLTVREKR